MKSRNTRRKFGQNYLKDPAILINKVLAANPKIERLFRIFEKKNLDPAPRPPPTKIKT